MLRRTLSFYYSSFVVATIQALDNMKAVARGLGPHLNPADYIALGRPRKADISALNALRSGGFCITPTRIHETGLNYKFTVPRGLFVQRFDSWNISGVAQYKEITFTSRLGQSIICDAQPHLIELAAEQLNWHSSFMRIERIEGDDIHWHAWVLPGFEFRLESNRKSVMTGPARPFEKASLVVKKPKAEILPKPVVLPDPVDFSEKVQVLSGLLVVPDDNPDFSWSMADVGLSFHVSDTDKRSTLITGTSCRPIETTCLNPKDLKTVDLSGHSRTLDIVSGRSVQIKPLGLESSPLTTREMSSPLLLLVTKIHGKKVTVRVVVPGDVGVFLKEKEKTESKSRKKRVTGDERKTFVKDAFGQPPATYVHPTPHGYGFISPTGYYAKSKNFSNSGYGGPAAARQAAIDYRDSVMPVSYVAAARRSDELGLNRVKISYAPDRPGKAGLYFELVKGYGYWVATCAKGGIELGSDMERFKLADRDNETCMLFALRARLRMEKSAFAHTSKLSEEQWMCLLIEVHSQFPRDIPNWDQFKFPGSITQIAPNRYIARITINKKLYSEVFDVKEYGWRSDTKMAAVYFLISTYKEKRKGDAQIVLKPTVRNSTSDRAGICLVRTKARDKIALVWSVTTKKNGKHFPVDFIAGNEGFVSDEKIELARQAAYMCRDAWEDHVLNGTNFDHDKWKSWKLMVAWPLESDGEPMEELPGAYLVDARDYLVKVPYLWNNRECVFKFNGGRANILTDDRRDKVHKVARDFLSAFRAYQANQSALFNPKEWVDWRSWSHWK